MQPVQIAIEGTDAPDAAEELITFPNLSAKLQTPDAIQRDGILAAIVTITSIAGGIGGALAAAEQIRKWYQEKRKKTSDRTITKAVLVGNGKRVLLEGATVEEIKAVLDILD